MREWRAFFSRLHFATPLHGLDAGRWRDLYNDTEWLLDNFAEHAAHDGWATADLFGLWPGKPNWGGVADRLRGSRSLVLTADRAHWRSFGVVERFNRGSYPDLRPLWVLAK